MTAFADNGVALLIDEFSLTLLVALPGTNIEQIPVLGIQKVQRVPKFALIFFVLDRPAPLAVVLIAFVAVLEIGGMCFAYATGSLLGSYGGQLVVVRTVVFGNSLQVVQTVTQLTMAILTEAVIALLAMVHMVPHLNVNSTPVTHVNLTFRDLLYQSMTEGAPGLTTRRGTAVDAVVLPILPLLLPILPRFPRFPRLPLLLGPLLPSTGLAFGADVGALADDTLESDHILEAGGIEGKRVLIFTEVVLLELEDSGVIKMVAGREVSYKLLKVGEGGLVLSTDARTEDWVKVAFLDLPVSGAASLGTPASGGLPLCDTLVAAPTLVLADHTFHWIDHEVEADHTLVVFVEGVIR